MSEATVSQFFERLKQDRDLASEYNTAMSDAVVPAMMSVAHRHGFEFSAQEMSDYLKRQSEELSEHELEGVSAGGVLSRQLWLSNPWVIGAIVSTAIATPLALDDGDDDGA